MNDTDSTRHDSTDAGFVTLDVLEARVLGCLIEKETTTPDLYPLSLNALVNACNQKNNRAPVMALGEAEVEGALDRLRSKRLVMAFSGANARAIKYRHRFSERFPVEPLAQAMLAELMLRGPQTTAGLRGNCERMVAVSELADCEALLVHLSERSEPLVRKLSRQTGQKEARWVQLLTGEPSPDEGAGASGTDGAREAVKVAVTMMLPAEAEARLVNLEAEVATLKIELARLRAALGEAG
ncbi:YceH family protein [Oleiharenicola lentus]|uniref:YceH family protein n=1 Tax=Oleiharenicola lentus TaxID=2508720 RepID=UPI003F67479E